MRDPAALVDTQGPKSTEQVTRDYLLDSIGLALNPEVLLDGRPFPLEVEQFAQICSPTLTDLLTLFLDPREVFKDEILG